MKIENPVRYSACLVSIAVVFLSSMRAIGEDSIPFKAMMESASSQAAVPPKPDASGAPAQQANRGHVTKAGKAEIATGFVLVGVGVITLSAAAYLSKSGFSPSGAKKGALYAGGAGAAGVGVTLIAFGFHKRSAK